MKVWDHSISCIQTQQDIDVLVHQAWSHVQIWSLCLQVLELPHSFQPRLLIHCSFIFDPVNNCASNILHQGCHKRMLCWLGRSLLHNQFDQDLVNDVMIIENVNVWTPTLVCQGVNHSFTIFIILNLSCIDVRRWLSYCMFIM
jgi:hypothetical protein